MIKSNQYFVLTIVVWISTVQSRRGAVLPCEMVQRLLPIKKLNFCFTKILRGSSRLVDKHYDLNIAAFYYLFILMKYWNTVPMYLNNRIYTLTKKIQPSGRYASEPYIKLKSLPSYCILGLRTTILLLCTLTSVVIACKVFTQQ